MTQGFIGYKFSAAGFAKVLIRAIFGVILFAVFSTTANAACTGSLPKPLTNNTLANADDVMENFNYLHDSCGGSGGTGPWATGSSNVISYTAGSVGIGTTSPGSGYLLDVNGSIHVSGTITCGAGCGAGGGTGPWNANGSTIYYSAGSVGIGTSTPSQALAVVGNIYATGNITCGGTCGGGGGGGSSQWATSGSGISFTSGNVGIGTTNPNYPLTVNSSTSAHIYLTGGASQNGLLFDVADGADQYYLYSGRTTSTAGFGLYDNTAAAWRLWVQNNGNVGVGTQAPGYTLHVNGTVYATGGAGALSDIRDKKDIAPLSITALDAISKLRPVTFVWKEAKDDGMKGRQTGLLAQEVEKVLPSAILTASDKRKSKAIKYNELTAVLIKAVQEQQKQIRAQAEEIRSMHLANQKLEARLARVERNRVARAN